MEYTFVLKDKGTINQGWWLKISSLSQLEDYIGKVGSSKVVRGILNAKEYYDGKAHADTLAQVIIQKAMLDHTSIVDAGFSIQASSIGSQIDALQSGPIYINAYGGWHSGGEYSDWLHSDQLVFPDFGKEQIRIKQFDGGKHYYAYIGDLQIRDGDKLKWDTYEEAYNQAILYINNGGENVTKYGKS